MGVVSKRKGVAFIPRARRVCFGGHLLETVVSMESDSDGAALVLQQCNDIIRLQEELCNSLQEKV